MEIFPEFTQILVDGYLSQDVRVRYRTFRQFDQWVEKNFDSLIMKFGEVLSDPDMRADFRTVALLEIKRQLSSDCQIVLDLQKEKWKLVGTTTKNALERTLLASLKTEGSRELVDHYSAAISAFAKLSDRRDYWFDQIFQQFGGFTSFGRIVGASLIGPLYRLQSGEFLAITANNLEKIIAALTDATSFGSLNDFNQFRCVTLTSLTQSLDALLPVSMELLLDVVSTFDFFMGDEDVCVSAVKLLAEMARKHNLNKLSWERFVTENYTKLMVVKVNAQASHAIDHFFRVLNSRQF